MQLYTAAIAARHKVTRRYALKAGSVIAETQQEAEEYALQAAEQKFPPGLYDDHQANVQLVPGRMVDQVFLTDRQPVA
jgi:hypothetical protein